MSRSGTFPMSNSCPPRCTLVVVGVEPAPQTVGELHLRQVDRREVVGAAAVPVRPDGVRATADDDGHDGGGQPGADPRPTPAGPAYGGEVDARRLHARDVPLDALGDRLLDAHARSPFVAVAGSRSRRRLARAAEHCDFTVPGRTPRASAISVSDRCS